MTKRPQVASGWTTAQIPDQSGRTILVTGANSGLGLRTAQALAARGARVVMACRNQAKAAEALTAVKEAASGPEPQVVPLDLADLASVRQCAADVLAEHPSLDVVVNNAGVMATPHRRTEQGYELQFGTNHLGHFALTGLLLPALLRAPMPRVVNVASIAHWGGVMQWKDPHMERLYLRWPAYAQSKLANLLFTSELQRRARKADVPLMAVAAHPGVATTHLYDLHDTGIRRAMLSVPMAFMKRVGQSDEMGALPQLYAATAPGVRGNDYYGAAGPLPGPFEIRGYPKRSPRSPLARNRTHARRLWELSERLTGVHYEEVNGDGSRG